jgi:hypothetical protein
MLQAFDRLATATSDLPNVAVSVLEWDDTHNSPLTGVSWDLLLGALLQYGTVVDVVTAAAG